MTNINELREAIQTFGSQAIDEGDLNELLDRLEAAEKERDEFKRACFAHISDNALLQSKIAEMERQEPVWWQTRTRPTWNDGTWGPWRKCSEEYAQDVKKTPLLHDWLYEARALYALPGAKGE